jgi:hypothetical protein
VRMRRRILWHLERAARALAAIPEEMPAGDGRSAAWARNEYAERAQWLRELKRWVLVPMQNTRVDLEVALKEVLGKIAAGDFSHLERHAIVPESRRARRTVRTAMALLVLVLVPTAVLAVNHWWHLGWEKDLEWVLGGAALIAVVKILFLLDPRFGEDFAKSKSVVDFFRGTSGEEKPRAAEAAEAAKPAQA